MQELKTFTQWLRVVDPRLKIQYPPGIEELLDTFKPEPYNEKYSIANFFKSLRNIDDEKIPPVIKFNG